MAYNKIFHNVPVQIQNRSGFDLSHQNLFTHKCGTLVPALVDLLIPGDSISLGHLTEVQLPPMASDFYGRVQFKYEAFFCPLRLLYGGFEQFITTPTNNKTDPDGYFLGTVKFLPGVDIPISESRRGSLADYLGFKGYGSLGSNQSFIVNNSLPFIAYHKIWNDWYRDAMIQTECFTRFTQNIEPNNRVRYAPYVTFVGDTPTVMDGTLADGVGVYSLRQRCWSKDYFTNAKVNPQAGNESSLAFNVVDDTASFTISSLRGANAIQQWMERNNLAGNRYISQIRAHFGVTPSDAILDRPVYLGSHSFDVYNKTVYQSASSEQSTNNPMSTVGSKFSSPLGVGDSSLVDNFTAKEHGFLFVMASLVPDAIYSTGERRYLDYQVLADFANPILSSVGDQEIKNKELCRPLSSPVGDDSTFGYTQRYSEYKFMLDEVHGELRDGGSLSAFALQRTFDTVPELSTSFVEIPTDFMDQVTAVTADMSKYGAWTNVYFKYKKSSVLPAYSIPTLGDPKDTHTEVISNGDIRL